MTFHSQDRFHAKWSFFARWYLYFGEWAAVRFPHACIAVSHTIQVFCRERFGREVIYIPNGAVERTVTSDAWVTRFGLRPRHYLLQVGRMVPHKGIHVLIDAYRALKQEGHALPDLVFVGAPSFTDAYMHDLKFRAGGDSQIHFLGFQEGESLAELFAHAALYVHPSSAEGLPLVVLEAMSYGLPVLVSDIPENLEAMHHAGFSFANKNVDDLKDKLLHLLRHPHELESARARSRATVRAYFHWENIVKETEEVYRTVRH